ncbi:hypothetical protein [Paenibacillus chungangensis]|uniref:Uncharacterized protein n=1 Tax=Paenibacillus chungangensis TaxID=696535 RepID=A0ABW3HND8_9BACL
MKWIICLSGDEADLYELSKSLNTEYLTVFKEGDQYYLKSSQILSTDEYREVSEKVKELVDLINGATKLALGTRNTIAVTDIYVQKDDGGRILFGSAHLSASIRVRASTQIIRADGTIEICNPADSVSNWLDLSQKNELINKVFKLISHDSDSWIGLFKIFEVIDKDSGIRSFSSVSSENLKRFTQTANSYKAVGMEARHALDYEPPKKPMNITEARSLIYIVVNEWLRQKDEM